MVARIVADRGLLVLTLAPPLDRVLRILGCFLVMERVIPGVQGLGSPQAQHFHRALTALAWASFRCDDLARLARFRRARAHGERAPAVTVHLGAKQLEGVRGTILRIASVGAVSLACGHGQDVRPHRARDPGGEFLRAERRLEEQEVSGRESPLRGGVGMHFDPAVPGDLRDRIGKLLEPRFVGAASVVENGVRKDDHFLISAPPPPPPPGRPPPGLSPPPPPPTDTARAGGGPFRNTPPP